MSLSDHPCHPKANTLGPLVGRATESEYVVDTVSNHGRALFVVGPPGSGRTSMLDSAATAAKRAELAVLRVSGGSEHLRCQLPGNRQLTLQPIDRSIDAAQVFKRLEEIAPWILLIDDLHHLSTDATRTLHGVCHMVSPTTGSLVVAVRAGARRTPIHASFLTEVSNRFLSSTIELGNLSRGDVHEVVTSVCGPDDRMAIVERLLEWTAGNPGLIASSLSELRQSRVGAKQNGKLLAAVENALVGALDTRLQAEPALGEALIRLALLLDGIGSDDLDLLAEVTATEQQTVAEELELLKESRSLTVQDRWYRISDPYRALLVHHDQNELRMRALESKARDVVFTSLRSSETPNQRMSAIACVLGNDDDRQDRDAIISAAANLAYRNPTLSHAALDRVDPSGVLALMERPLVIDRIDNSPDRAQTIDRLAELTRSMPDRRRFDTLASAVVVGEQPIDGALVQSSVGIELLSIGGDRAWHCPMLELALANTLVAAGDNHGATQLLDSIETSQDPLPWFLRLEPVHLAHFIEHGRFDLETAQAAVDETVATPNWPEWQIELAAVYLADGSIRRCSDVLTSCSPPAGRLERRHRSLWLMAEVLIGRPTEVWAWATRNPSKTATGVGHLAIALAGHRLGHGHRGRRWLPDPASLHPRWHDLYDYVEWRFDDGGTTSSDSPTSLWRQLGRSNTAGDTVSAVRAAQVAGLVDPALDRCLSVASNPEADDGARQWCLAELERSGDKLRLALAKRHTGDLKDAIHGSATSDELSASDRQICELVASGLTNREVAQELALSTHTVSNRLKRLFVRFGVQNRTALGVEFRAWDAPTEPGRGRRWRRR